MNKAVISVIMPAFRNKDTLARAIDSFLNQDLKEPCELIIGIDDSGDGTLELALEYSKKHPNIKLHQEDERMGQALSRYKAIQDSEGDYIYFMDADDELTKDCLSTFLETIRRTDADCVNSSFYVVDSKKTFKFPFTKNSTLNTYEAMLAFFMDASFRGFLWTKMWKREIFEKRPLLLLLDRKDMYEDVAFVVSLLSYCKKIVTIKNPLYYYYKNVPTSATSVQRTDRAMRHLWAFALARHFFEKTNNELLLKAFKKRTFRCSLSLMFDLSLDKKAKASKEYLAQVKKEWKEVKNLKKPLPLEGRSYSDALRRAWHY